MFKNVRKGLMTGMIGVILVGLVGCGGPTAPAIPTIEVPAGSVGIQAGGISVAVPESNLWAKADENKITVQSDSKIEFVKATLDQNEQETVKNIFKKKSDAVSPFEFDVVLNKINRDPSKSELVEVKDGVAIIKATYTSWWKQTADNSWSLMHSDENYDGRTPRYVIAMTDGESCTFAIFKDKDLYEKAMANPAYFKDEYKLLATDGGNELTPEGAQKLLDAANSLQADLKENIEKQEIRVGEGYATDGSDDRFFGRCSLCINSTVNESSKNIREVEVAFTAYNGAGMWTNFSRYSTNYGSPYVSYFTENIPAGESTKTEWKWEVHNDASELNNVQVIVKSALFDDGTRWENPLYDLWVDKYAEKNFEE